MSEKLKLLILSSGYPSENNIYESAFVRTRVEAYQKAGHEVAVINFSAPELYELAGVRVYPPTAVVDPSWDWSWDVAVFHAPNIRYHMRFIWKHFSHLPAICWTHHGHEVLHLNKSYLPPFPWARPRFHYLRRFVRGVYDICKMPVLSLTLEMARRFGKNPHLIFVSEDFRQEALGNYYLSSARWEPRMRVIHNPLAQRFLEHRHQVREKLGDFITIRPIDSSKYCVDLIVEFAQNNPDYSFHVYGSGQYFERFPAPPNLTHFPGYLNHEQIVDLVDRYQGALMPSRWDTHGVMMCELAATGLPLLAGEMPVHREVLAGFQNVEFLNLSEPSFDAEGFLQRTRARVFDPPQRFAAENTVGKEIELFGEMSKG